MASAKEPFGDRFYRGLLRVLPFDFRSVCANGAIDTIYRWSCDLRAWWDRMASCCDYQIGILSKSLEKEAGPGRGKTSPPSGDLLGKEATLRASQRAAFDHDQMKRTQRAGKRSVWALSASQTIAAATLRKESIHRCGGAHLSLMRASGTTAGASEVRRSIRSISSAASRRHSAIA